MDGENWIPPIKSRQPGPGVSGDVTKTTLDTVSDSDHKSDIGIAKYIGFDKGKQIQTKDTGIHKQP